MRRSGYNRCYRISDAAKDSSTSMSAIIAVVLL